MKTKDYIDVFSTLDSLRTAEYGKATKILPDTFLVKFPTQVNRFGNGYILRHLNKKDVLLIDVTSEEATPVIDRLNEKGYNIKGLLLSNKELITKAKTDLDAISKHIKNAPIFVHPLDNGTQAPATKDITAAHQIFEEFLLSVFHFPGRTAGSVVIYSEINNGMLFTGGSAIGSAYENNDYTFQRPIIENKENDYGLSERWKAFTKYFEHILPLYGKPQFELSEGQQKDIILNLSKDQPTKTI